MSLVVGQRYPRLERELMYFLLKRAQLFEAEPVDRDVIIGNQQLQILVLKLTLKNSHLQ